MSLSRREVLRVSAGGGLGIVVAGSLSSVAGAPAAQAALRPPTGYGPLRPDPAGLLALPAGFRYRVIAQTGVTRLESGEPTPSDPDGMGLFPAPNGGSTLVCNHEIGATETYGVPALSGLTYDPGARGGATTITVDRDGRRRGERVSLAGTHNNCAGGVTPWGTWLSCEESEQRAVGPFQKTHGYAFEVDPHDAAANRRPVPLTFLGRFAHEAVVVDPLTHAIYQTEDAANPNGLYYRWTPPPGFRGGKGRLRALAESADGDEAGTLEAMRCVSRGAVVVDLSQATKPGTTYQVTWVAVPDRDASSESVRKQVGTRKVTRARKLEGAWWGDGGAYFVSSFARTADGSAAEHDGQVWFYDPRRSTVTLKTIFGVNPAPDRRGGLDGPDNITVSPDGGVILAEDGGGLSHLIGVTEGGKAYPLARNQLNNAEFAGPVFGADGTTLYVSVQNPGHVLAITGPWRRSPRR
ncbi:alkaline phosphatase PhoX [Pilimelia columellifera]|uniref:PhoX family protein n=1 Tax=Pilimelia columellifera subsp. columellifera TaxID=706583 RepID=A0ABN3NDL8_9ACTN